MRASRYCCLAQPDLPPDLTHTNADECYGLACPYLWLLCLIAEFLKFSHQAHFQPQISHVLVDAMPILGMVCPQSRPLFMLVSAATWPLQASSYHWLLRVSDLFLLDEFHCLA